MSKLPPTNTALRFRARNIEKVWAEPTEFGDMRVWSVDGEGPVTMSLREFGERYEVDDTGLGTHLNQVTHGSR